MVKQQIRGFSLVELLIVIAIIGILSVIALTVFTASRRSANNARRRADIDAIGKAYEINYAGDTYQLLTADDFADKSMPEPPGGGSYTYVSGPNSTTSCNAVRVCSTIEPATGSCGETSGSCYCYTGRLNPSDCLIVAATAYASSSSSTSSSPSSTTVNFNSKSGENQPLDGQYPSGVIDWGSHVWYHSGPYGTFNTKSISFKDASINSGSFALLIPKLFTSVDTYNGGSVSTTIAISCPGQSSRAFIIPPDTVRTLSTNWTGVCTPITISSTNGWDTNFNRLVFISP